MMTTSKSKNDCVVVSLSNYFGLEYAEVVKLLQAKGWIDKGVGVYYATYMSVIIDLLGRPPIIRKPRRGADKLTGLALVGKYRRYQHLTVIVDGNIFDTNGEVVPLIQYRAKGWKVNEILF